MSENNESEYTIKMKRLDNYKFEVDFGSEIIPNILTDEPTSLPGGEGKGPTASMLLAAAVGNCLSASLIFCSTKKQVDLLELETTVKFKRERNEKGFWRISEMEVDLEPVIDDKDGKFQRCEEIFKDYCIITQSVETGIPIKVNLLKG
ncbi:MAG: OsmC family protein [Candidatus Heimdallarchaeota archaeon]|nr:OsmC family protein [Candidatus Heimdallarchaeota archaeon]